MHPETPFIAIGTRGTSFPIGLKELPPPLREGKNEIYWSGPKENSKNKLGKMANAFVSKQRESFELYRLPDALAQNRVRAIAAKWTVDGVVHKGTAYVRSDWKPERGQPQHTAVVSETWQGGRVEAHRVNDGRNASRVAKLLLAGPARGATDRNSRRTWLLKWNPKTTDWEELQAIRKQTRRGETVRHRWSCGRTKAIQPGDRLFMLKTGANSGIIASGVAATQPFEQPHWTDETKTSLYLQVDLDTLLDPDHDKILLLNSFKSNRLNSFPWGIQGSGHEIPRETAGELEHLWGNYSSGNKTPESDFSDDVPDAEFQEGTLQDRTLKQRTRNIAARDACVRFHGVRCKVCDMSFEEVYGSLGAGFIHVHHLKQLARSDGERSVSAVEDLRPVCPNCHAMLHRPVGKMLTIDELRARMAAHRRGLAVVVGI